MIKLNAMGVASPPPRDADMAARGLATLAALDALYDWWMKQGGPSFPDPRCTPRMIDAILAIAAKKAFDHPDVHESMAIQRKAREAHERKVARQKARRQLARKG